MTHPDPSLGKDKISDLTLTSRKEQHLDVVLAGQAGATVTTGLEAVIFEHVALPEVSWDDVDLSTDFLGHRIGAPVMMSPSNFSPVASTSLKRR